MRTARILLLCILGAALLSAVNCNNAIGPDDCCSGFYPRRLNKNLIKSYYLTDHRCPKSGVNFVMIKGRHICVDPTLSWVENIMRSLDESSPSDKNRTPTDSPSDKTRTASDSQSDKNRTPTSKTIKNLNYADGFGCCFTFISKGRAILRRNLIKSYHITDHRCAKSGVIFVTKKLNRPICVDPTLSWVENIMRFVDESSF